MEYNTMLYKVFKWVKNPDQWIFVRTFYSYTEASIYCNEHSADGVVYLIEGEKSHD
jgi:hypothetical protein